MFGHIDVLVNNAGCGYLAAVEEGDEKDIRAVFDTNFFGMAAMIRAVLPGMRARRHGYIVNIASVGGIVGFAGSGYYVATKFAVEGLSESLAKEVEPLGIRVLVAEPGPFRTDWVGRSLKQSPNFIDDYQRTAGARRQETAEYRQAGRRSGKGCGGGHQGGAISYAAATFGAWPCSRKWSSGGRPAREQTILPQTYHHPCELGIDPPRSIEWGNEGYCVPWMVLIGTTMTDCHRWSDVRLEAAEALAEIAGIGRETVATDRERSACFWSRHTRKRTHTAKSGAVASDP
ncbi:MAG TPA: SDR family NAD(P)-dependent oxidoreductase [Stellaceae bacterium]|nr:SDR family NAD(P)-dependent oxidoreductase [Stellaceae bacterium]